MNKVWSAKRKEVEITYEFLDGTSASLKVVSLSTNEKIKMGELAQKDGVVLVQDKSYFIISSFQKLKMISILKLKSVWRLNL